MDLELFNGLRTDELKFIYIYRNFQQNSDIIYDKRLRLIEWDDIRECLDCILSSSIEPVAGTSVVDVAWAQSKWIAFCRDKKLKQLI